MTRRFSKLLILSLAGLLALQISSRADTTDTALVKSAVLEGDVVYLQVGQVGTNLPDEISAAQNTLAVSNKIAGTVLDLRFAGGDDVKAAKTAAKLFAAKKLPLAILVNGGTCGESVALAAMLREAREGLVFGSTTQGTKTAEPIQPDIAIKVGLEDERALMENPYAAPALNGTNALVATNNLLPFVDHTSEADLVRARIKDGNQDDGSTPGLAPEQVSEPQPRVIRDPVLARAVDLIKGLAVVRAHS